MEAYYPGRCQPTVFGADSYDAAEDAQALHAAMEGAGTDEQTIIDILARRNIAQRLDIAERYKVMYGESIVKDLKSELRGNFEDVIVGLLTPLPEYYAKELHHAISGMGTDEGAIIEILCTLSRHGVAVISDTYQKKYERSLEDDLKGEASGHFKRLLVSLCQATQRESGDVSEQLVMEDVQALLDAGENSWGTDESKFHEILMSRGTGHLAEVFKQYENVAGHDIVTAIKREFSGNMETALVALAKCVMNRAQFFADRLYKAMHGMGTDDRTLIRIIVSRCEIDLGDIKVEYQNKYGKSLEEKIESECSSYYKKLLIALVA